MKTTLLHNMVYCFLTARHIAHILLKLLQDAFSLKRFCHSSPTYLVARTISADARSPAASLLWFSSNDHPIVQFSLAFLQGGIRGVQDSVFGGAVGWLPSRPPIMAAVLLEL